jgi:hypothetical protein
MAFLFTVTEKTVYPNTETLLVNPFKEIWERDKSKQKYHALEEFAYIEFMSSMKKSNPYRQYPENQKEEKVVKDVITDRENWKPDELIKQAIHKLIKFQSEASTTYNYYMAAKRAAEKMQEFFNEVDITAVNPKTFNPVYKPRDITSALNDTEKVLGNLKTLEKKVEEELYEETKNRSNKEISFFADPESLR